MTFLADLRDACERSTYKKFDTYTGPVGGGLASLNAADLMRLADSFDEMRTSLGAVLDSIKNDWPMRPEFVSTVQKAYEKAVSLAAKQVA